MTDQNPYDPSQQPPVPPPPPPGYGQGYPAQPGYPAQGFDPAAPFGRDAYGRPMSDKSKVVAGLLQIFLGIFGVGRFYTGHTKLAVWQLVVGVLTCGIGSIWAFVDGILILVKNDWTDARGFTCVPEVRRVPLAPLAVLAGGAAGAAWLLVQDPHEPGHLFPGCPFRALTGLQCPACGGTRVAYDLLHLDLAAAWRDNALVLLLAPLLLGLLARWLVVALRGATYRVPLGACGGAVCLATAASWAVLRNVA